MYTFKSIACCIYSSNYGFEVDYNHDFHSLEWNLPVFFVGKMHLTNIRETKENIIVYDKTMIDFLCNSTEILWAIVKNETSILHPKKGSSVKYLCDEVILFASRCLLFSLDSSAECKTTADMEAKFINFNAFTQHRRDSSIGIKAKAFVANIVYTWCLLAASPRRLPEKLCPRLLLSGGNGISRILLAQ